MKDFWFLLEDFLKIIFWHDEKNAGGSQWPYSLLEQVVEWYPKINKKIIMCDSLVRTRIGSVFCACCFMYLFHSPFV